MLEATITDWSLPCQNFSCNCDATAYKSMQNDARTLIHAEKQTAC